MTTLVLLVLAIIWIVLAVSWLRSRSQSTFGDSVGTFRRHLTTLEKAAPSRVMPANRLRGMPVHGRSPHAYRSVVPISAARNEPLRSPAAMAPALGPRRLPNSASLRRRQAQKRRRDVFIALLVGVVGSLLLAIVPGLSVMWPVQGLFDVLLVGYMALLVHIRNVAAERDLAMTRMPARRRVAASSEAPSYDFGGGYGALDLRRVAN